ncbi:hypothetical protein [Clostridium sp. AM58-1XD]|uniref:hypothetical protein n=1 Tax=Clostridium sp. AM58-1XD TaxID=2292307 RepID=UPI000E47B928|nr:hypothetical protein [Clostridium sp. AM58-1XD]RGY95320.1 hypothetical protein DXA13_19440 [Clostridium sp. AM58-1XD]
MSLDSFWLLETLLKLSCFTMDDKANQLAGSICLNTRAKRAEALDVHHAGIRKMPEDVFIHWEGELKLKSLAYVKENEYEFLICSGIIKPEDKERIEKLITTDFV